ncbi:MAG: molybdopterin-dependent oxidoreductase, partial [FCB group bacterium]
QALNEAFRCLECGCSEYYDCVFRKYADEYEIDISEYLGEVRKFKVDKRHPFITFDPNKCINCGKCVRICSEILKVSALGFVNRGFKSVVKPAMEKPLLDTNCIACGNCIDVCPTGAISEKFPHKILGTMPKLNQKSICNFCSIGCNINYKVVDNDIFYVSNSTEEIINSKNNGYLCLKGRFGHRYLLDKENRLESAGIKENDQFRDVSIDEAIEYSSNKIKEIITKYGSDSVAVFASPKLSNEELYLLQKFARVGLKTNNISSFSDMLYGKESDCLDECLGATVSTITMDELKNTDIIIVMNTDTEENLILELKIKEALKKGAKLIIISSSETGLTKSASLWLDTRKGTNTILINALIKEYLNNHNKNNSELRKMVSPFDAEAVSDFAGVEQEKFKKLLRLVKDSEKNIVFVYNLDSLKEKSKNDLKAVYNFMKITNRIHRENNGLLILREFSNSTGLQDMGVNPQHLPGYVKFNEKNEIKHIGDYWSENLEEVFKPVDIPKALLDGKIKAVLIFGENPLIDSGNAKYFNGVEFLMVLDSFKTETTLEANVVIPTATSAEQHGTYTSCDTKIQKFKPVINKRNNLENWEIFSKLAKNFSNSLNFESYDVLFDEIIKVNRLYFNCQVDEYWNKNIRNKEFLRQQRKLDYLYYKIDTGTFNPVKANLHYSDDYFFKFIKNRLNVTVQVDESYNKIQVGV